VEEYGFHQLDFGVHQIRACDLGGIEIRQKAELLSDRRKCGKILLIIRRAIQMGHLAPPASLYNIYSQIEVMGPGEAEFIMAEIGAVRYTCYQAKFP